MRVEHRTGDTASLLAGTRHLQDADMDHRAEFFEYVLEHAEEWHQTHLRRLYAHWQLNNEKYFGGELYFPYIELLEPSAPNVYGDCSPTTGFGGKLGIRIRPSLLTGTHPRMRSGADYAEGRFEFVADVLLHEMIHQWQQEVTGQTEDSYHGHGPAFRDKANEIGDALMLRRVRTNKARGKDKDWPSCAQWPHNVRGWQYYNGAYVPASRDKPSKPEKVTIPLDLEAALPILRKHFDVDELCRRLPEGTA